MDKLIARQFRLFNFRQVSSRRIENQAGACLTALYQAFPRLSDKDLHDAAQQLASSIRDIERGLQVRVDPTSARLMIEVCDPRSSTVLRQVPPPPLLEIAERFSKGGAVSQIFSRKP